MATKNILIVTKDRAEAQIYIPIVQELHDRGFGVAIVAEGLSLEMWNKAAWHTYGRPLDMNKVEMGTLIRHDINAWEVIDHVKPAVVMTGLGAPINLGQSFGLAANDRRIPLGFVEDLWGVHKRSTAVPDFICTVDDFGKNRIEAFYGRGVIGQISITGSPALDELLKIKADALTESILWESKQVILIGGQDESTTPLVRGLVEELECTDIVHLDRVIIPRFHPNWMIDPSKASFRDDWTGLLYRANQHNRVLWTPTSVSTQSLIPLATIVVSIYSNILVEAAALGTLAVSWTSDIGRAKMKEALGVEQFPLVGLGGAIEVSNPDEFYGKAFSLSGVARQAQIDRAKQVVHADGKATERVVNVILAHI